jgi:prevent-host-death family protein
MKKALVSELKARLSWYLAEVRRGQAVVVCDRATPIARLVPYANDAQDGFEVVPAAAPAGDLRNVRGVLPKRSVDVVQLLREDRESR